MTTLREAAQMALDALIDAADSQSWEMQQNIEQHGEWYRRSVYLKQATAKSQGAIEALRAALAQPETPYLTGARLFREGKGISFIQTAVRTDADIGEALQGWEDAKTSEEIAQPEQEPVAHVCRFEKNGRPDIAWDNCRDMKIGTKLYAIPPKREWQGLTDEEIEDACWTEVDQRLRSFARAIEAKLKEKNA